MGVERMRQRGSDVYGGVAATINSQTMMDVRVIADFHRFVKENGGDPGSISSVIREVCYWMHEQLVREGLVHPLETVEEALHHLTINGLRVGQVKGDRRNNGMKNALSQEGLQADFGRTDSRANTSTLLGRNDLEDEVRREAMKFLQSQARQEEEEEESLPPKAPIPPDEQTQLERDALRAMPTGAIVEEEESDD